MKKKWFYSVAPVLLLLSACGKSQPGSEGKWVKVQAEKPVETLQETGTLEAKVLARLQVQVEGTISEVAEDNTTIQAGEVVLKLDDEELRTELETEIGNLDQIREDFENEMAEYAVLTNTFEITSRLKGQELKHAQLELEITSIPLTPEEKRLREIEIELAVLDLEDKKSQLAREQELVRKNFAAASTLQSAEREKQAAQTYLEEKRSQLKLDSMPITDEERLTLETAVKNAEDAVRRNQQKQDRDLHIQDLKLEGLRLKIEHTEENIRKLREKLSNVVLVAPTGGILRLTQNWSHSIRSWIPLAVGQNIWGLNVAGTIVDPQDLMMRVIIHESDYPLVKPGQLVQAKLTSYPDQLVNGTVESITELGQDLSDLSPVYRQAPSIYQAMFLVNIRLDTISENLIPGMTALAEIQIGSEQKQLLIPEEALRKKNGQLRVIRRRDEIVEEVNVKGRRHPDGRFAVQEGLKDGDEIQIRDDAV